MRGSSFRRREMDYHWYQSLQDTRKNVWTKTWWWWRKEEQKNRSKWSLFFSQMNMNHQLCT